jgi:hypothetical protein
MRSCETCRQVNPDDARFCQQCGTALSPSQTTPPVWDEAQLWRKFIGPNADRYLETFKKFSGASGPRFAFTWNWPAFLFEPFLWFLYRKMYLYALVYAVGPVAAFYFTQDLSADLVWRIMAGASAGLERFGRSSALCGVGWSRVVRFEGGAPHRYSARGAAQSQRDRPSAHSARPHSHEGVMSCGTFPFVTRAPTGRGYVAT